MKIAKQNRFGKKVWLGLEQFGGTPGAHFSLRLDSGSSVFLPYIRNVKEALEENQIPCRKAFDYLIARGFKKIWITYFDGSPLDAIFDRLGAKRFALFRNYSGKLERFRGAESDLNIMEVDYDDARVLSVYQDYARLKQNRLISEEPQLVLSMNCFDAFVGEQKPRLVLDRNGELIGSFFFWDEPTYYDPKVALPVIYFNERAASSGLVDKLFHAAHSHMAHLGFSNALFHVDDQNESLKKTISSLGYSEVSGFAGKFLCRVFEPQ